MRWKYLLFLLVLPVILTSYLYSTMSISHADDGISLEIKTNRDAEKLFKTLTQIYDKGQYKNFIFLLQDIVFPDSKKATLLRDTLTPQTDEPTLNSLGPTQYVSMEAKLLHKMRSATEKITREELEVAETKARNFLEKIKSQFMDLDIDQMLNEGRSFLPFTAGFKAYIFLGDLLFEKGRLEKAERVYFDAKNFSLGFKKLSYKELKAFYLRLVQIYVRLNWDKALDALFKEIHKTNSFLYSEIQTAIEELNEHQENITSTSPDIEREQVFNSYCLSFEDYRKIEQMDSQYGYTHYDKDRNITSKTEASNLTEFYEWFFLPKINRVFILYRDTNEHDVILKIYDCSGQLIRAQELGVLNWKNSWIPNYHQIIQYNDRYILITTYASASIFDLEGNTVQVTNFENDLKNKKFTEYQSLTKKSEGLLFFGPKAYDPTLTTRINKIKSVHGSYFGKLDLADILLENLDNPEVKIAILYPQNNKSPDLIDPVTRYFLEIQGTSKGRRLAEFYKKFLDHPDPIIRRQILLGLFYLDRESLREPAFERLVKDSSADVRGMATWCLIHSHKEGDVALLEDLYNKEKDPSVQFWIHFAIEQITKELRPKK